MKADTQNKKLNIHLERETVERLTKLAERKGWINETGCAAGKPSMQAAIAQAVQAGIDVLEK